MTGNISNEFLMNTKERQQDIVSNAVDGVCRYCTKEDCNGCFVQELKDEAVKDEPVTNPWETFGNVDFLSHGGCFVRRCFAKEPEIHENVFDVFYLSPKFGEKNENSFAALCCIDLTASWLPWGKMLKHCGFNEDINLSIDELVKKHDPMFLAKKMVTYLGIASFSPRVFKNGAYNMHPRNVEDFTVSNDDVTKWLHDLGAESIINEQVKACEEKSLTVGDIVNNSKFDFNANFAVYLCDKYVTWDQAGEPAFSTGVKESENKVPIEELYDCEVVYMTISNHTLIIEVAKEDASA